MASPAVTREAPAEVTVNLRADGALTVDGRPVAMEDLSGVLGVRVAARPSTAAPPRVVLRADRRQRFGDLDKVLEACCKAGLAAVVLRTQGEG
jgi:biopolymer transport protein ExbD